MINFICISGRLTRDPETRQTTSGKAVVRFSIANDRPVSGEKQTDFFSCVAYDRNAEYVSKYVAKGQFVEICGRLQINKWTDKNGANRETPEIIVNSISSVGKATGEPAATAAEPKFNEYHDEGDLPF